MAKAGTQVCFPAWRRLYRKMIADPNILCEGLIYGLKVFSAKQKTVKVAKAAKSKDSPKGTKATQALEPFGIPSFTIKCVKLFSESDFSRIDPDLLDLTGVPSKKYVEIHKSTEGLKEIPKVLERSYKTFFEHSRFQSCFIRQVCVDENTIRQEHRLVTQSKQIDFDMVLCPSGHFVYGLDVEYIASVLKQKDPKLPELTYGVLHESPEKLSSRYTPNDSLDENAFEYPAPAAVVKLSDPFLIMSKPVTVDMFTEVLGLNLEFLRRLRYLLPHLERDRTEDSERYGSTSDLIAKTKLSLSGNKPVMDGVSFLLACVFCNELSRRQALPDYYEFFDRVSGKRYSNIELLARQKELGSEANIYKRIADDAEFENRLNRFHNSIQIKRKKGSKGYRLPTAIEWEYAAKAGEDTLFAGSNRMGDGGYYKTGNQDVARPDVGLKKPNPWGIYDMYGVVYEYCDAVYMSRKLLLEAFTPTAQLTEYIDSSGNIFKIVDHHGQPRTLNFYENLEESEEVLELVKQKKLEAPIALESKQRAELKALKEQERGENYYSSDLSRNIRALEYSIDGSVRAIKKIKEYPTAWVRKGTNYNYKRYVTYTGVSSYFKVEGVRSTGFRVARSL